jgi:cytochrome c
MSLRPRLLVSPDRATAAGWFAVALFAASAIPAAASVASALPAAASVASALPAAAHTAAETQALVERAAAHIQAVGPERAFADFTRPDGGFVDGDLYVFCIATDGTQLANGGNPKLVGKNLVAVRDSRGTLIGAEIRRIGLTQGHGWVEYYWPNPRTRRVQRKDSYVLRIDDRTLCASGYYTPDAP